MSWHSLDYSVEAMTLLDEVESARLELQNLLDTAKTQAERNRLGQFATPSMLASDILDYAETLLPGSLRIRFLDPAFGTGSFYSALLRSSLHSRIADAQGFEIDPYYGHDSVKLWGQTPLRLHISDFTHAEPPSANDARADLLICNPPYVRHHHVPASEKIRLQWIARKQAGVRLNGLAGLYCYFLCIAHGWMAENGVAGWLIPSEFMDVNYGRQVKEYLLDRVTLLRIHRFDPNDVQFDDALVSSAVVWLRKTPPPANHAVEFTYGSSLSTPRTIERIPTHVLRHTLKWTRLASAIQGGEANGTTHFQEPKLSDLFKIQRGVATGANGFFVLTPEQIAKHNLPTEFLTPILPSPRYMSEDEIEANDEGKPILDRTLFLLTCDRSEAEVKASFPTLWRYLQLGIEGGIGERYLCKHRSPWYAQEKRRPAPFLCTYMGRQDTMRGRAFRFVLNHSEAIAPNVYLLLYPKPLLQKELEDKPDRLRAVWQALNNIPLETLIGEGRVYGGGLHKMEPKELGNASARELLSALPGLAIPRFEQRRLFED